MYSGTLVLKVEGENLNKFLNMLIFNKILLKLHTKQDHTTIISISIKDFKKVVKIAKRTECKFKILEKKGIYFYLKELTIWKVTTIGICIIILAIFNQFIFDIYILNNTSSDILLNESIKNKLYQYNVKPFVLKSKINEKEVERKLLSELSDLMWIKVKKEGVRLLVEYVKREKGEFENKKGKIFAATSGVIKRIILKSGNLLVKEGDTVVCGQLLVDNKVVAKDGIEYYEDANAQIEAVTYYTIFLNYSMPFYRKEYISKTTVPYIKVGNYEIKLKNIVTKNENCDKIKIKEYKLSPLAIWVGVYEIRKYKLKEYIPTLKQIKEKIKLDRDKKFLSITKDKKILNVLTVRTNIRLIKQKSKVKRIECEINYECLEEIGIKK